MRKFGLLHLAILGIFLSSTLGLVGCAGVSKEMLRELDEAKAAAQAAEAEAKALEEERMACEDELEMKEEMLMDLKAERDGLKKKLDLLEAGY